MDAGMNIRAGMRGFGEAMTATLAHRGFHAAAAVLLLAALAVFYAQLLPVGTFKYIDEYWTLDRSASFVARNDWSTVYSENLPNFNKPPLQYWWSAWLMERGHDLELALRLPSTVFALLLLPLAGLVAWQLCANPVVFPAAMLVLASSFRFWESGLSALLDLGSAFFATAALAAFFAATREPRWWYGVAFLAGLGSLQKAPLALGFLAVAIAVFAVQSARARDGEARRTFANRHFAIALVILVMLHLVWPAIQYMKHGPAFIQQAYVEQIWIRFAGDPENSERANTWFKGLFRGQPLLEAPLIAAVLAAPFVFRNSRALTLAILFVAYVVLSGVAGHKGSVRYAILFYPLMAASLSAIAAHYLGAKAFLWMVLYSLVLGTPFKGAERLRLDQGTQSRHIGFMQRIAAAAQPGEAFVRCTWDRGKNPPFPGAISYYASAGRPVRRLEEATHLNAVAGDGPYRGICTLAEFEDLKAVLAEPVAVEISGNHVHWKAKGPLR